MAPKQPTKTTTVTEVKLPDWVNRASQSNYAFAERIASKPYQAYGGQTVADTTQTTRDAYDYFKNTMDTGVPQVNQANELFAKAGQGILGLNRNDYMNPYIDNVETKAMEALDKARIQSLMGNTDSAAAAKAFGGSRHGVVDAVTNAESIQNAGLLSADLRRQAYDNASGLMQGDIDNFMKGGQGLLTGAEALQGLRGTNFSGLLGIGTAEQQQNQRVLDDQYGRWNEAQNYDTEQLNLLLSSLGMSPYGKSESSTTTQKQGSAGTDWAQAGLGVLSLLFGMFSDRDDKTDIEKLGKDPATGLDMYAYRYKNDPKSYPKVVGPMAQDIEKKFPGLVGEIGGHKTVGGAGILANG